MMIDVSRAYTHAAVHEYTFCEIVPDARTADNAGMCWKLKKSMYGTRPAALNWQRGVAKQLTNLGFEIGKGSVCMYHHPTLVVVVFVHGDDFVCSGERQHLEWIKDRLQKVWTIKHQMIGEDGDLCKRMRILNRIVRLHDGEGLTSEPDPQHVMLLIQEMKVGDKPALSTPGVKTAKESDEKKATDNAVRKARGTLGTKAITTNDEGADDPLLQGEEATSFRALVARAIFWAADRVDLMFSVKEIARHMSSPRRSHWALLDRLARFVVGHGRLVTWMRYQPEVEQLTTWTDSDWAGCHRTRRSTSGGIVLRGGHFIKAWSRTQALVALSSAEAERYASIKATAETIGITNLFLDRGTKVSGIILTDASAALSLIKRRGLGKNRHISTRYMWIQDNSDQQRMKFEKVQGTETVQMY